MTFYPEKGVPTLGTPERGITSGIYFFNSIKTNIGIDDRLSIIHYQLSSDTIKCHVLLNIWLFIEIVGIFTCSEPLNAYQLPVTISDNYCNYKQSKRYANLYYSTML